MSTKQYAQVDVDVNGKPAEDKINALQSKAKELKKSLQDAFEAGDVKSYEKHKKELSAIQKEAKQIEKQMWDIDKVMRNLGGATPRELKRAFNQLNRELNSGDVKRGSSEWKALTANLKRVKSEMQRVNNEIRTTQPLLSRVSDGFNKYFGIITAGIASLTGIIFTFRKAVDASNDFGESVANLSSLTGLVGEELDYLRQRALEFSGSVTEDGIRITKSAQDIIDAYTQMGSKRPELLKDKEALASVTEQAIILSQAAKMDLVPATNSLAISMNQFNATASDAPRYINAIAAGSKEGAGDVLYIADALEKAGTAADLAGLSIEETIGVIETIAPKFSEPSRAGTQLKNVFIKLQTGADQFNPAIVGMEKALTNLANANMSVAELTKMFGVENINAAQTLIAGREEYVRYRDAVTGTSVAIEQASINTNTNKARLEAARQTLNKVTIELGEKLAPALTFSTSSFSYLIKGVMAAIRIFNEYKGIILSSAAAIAAYTIAIQVSAKWDSIHYAALVAKDTITKVYGVTTSVLTGKVKLATIAQRAWNNAQKANLMGWLIAAIMGAITALSVYASRLKDISRAEQTFNDVMIQAKKNIVEQRVEMELLMKTAKDETKSKEDRISAIKKLNELSPDYLGNLTLEKINTDEAKTATDQYIVSLERKARAQAAQDKLIEIERELLDLHEQGVGSELTFLQKLQAGVETFGNVNTMASNAALISANNWKSKEEELLEVKQKLLGVIEQTNKETPKPGGGKTVVTTMSLDEYIAAHAAEFEAWKTSRTQFLDDQSEFELKMRYGEEELQKRLSLIDKIERETAAAEAAAKQKYADAMAENFELEDEDSIPDSPEVRMQMLTNEYILNQWMQTEEGKLAAKEGFLSKEEMLIRASASNEKKIHQDVMKSKLQDAMSYFQMASQLAAALTTYYQAQMNRELSAAGDNETQKEAIRLKYAKKEQEMAVIQARINGALSIMSMWATAPNPIIGAIYTAIAIAMTEFQVAAIKSQQFNEGLYPVIGKKDGRTYNARMYGKPTTTEIVKGPALISELEDEMIVDGPTTRNLVFNYPHIVQGIKQLSNGGTPQFSEGKYPVTTESATTVSATNVDPELKELLQKLSTRLDQPIEAFLLANENMLRALYKKMDEYDSFMNKVAG